MPANAALANALLVVDDEPQVLTALKDQLEDEYTVFVQTSAASALEFLVVEPNIAVIISDQRMPEMAGDEFLARARKISGATRILITGYADLKAVIRAINEGQIFGYISKPWDAAQLKIAVHKAVEYFEITRELAQERALLHNLMDSLPDAVFFKDIAHRYLKVNRAKATTMGVADPEQAVGKTAEAFSSKERARELEQEEDEILRTGKPVVDKVEKFVAVDGAERWLSKTKAPIFNDRGEIVSFVGVARDITERKIAEQQLLRAQKMEAIGQLTGGIAHDFNNLLTVILGNLELLEEGLPRDEKLQEWASLATRAASRGAELTRRLLAFSRQQVLEPANVDLNAIVKSLAGMITRTFGEPIEVRTTLALDLWLARIDPAQLESALLNLCVNARDAMPGGGRLTIETTNAVLDASYAQRYADVAPGEYVLLAVSDTGTGMPPEVVERVFEPFFTTKEEGKGTGLGLSMVYGFVKQSGGHINIYSEIGRGTSVKVYFPRLHDENARVGTTKVATTAPRGTETILVVEDERDVRETAVMMLESLGYKVLVAENGPAALKILEGPATVDLLFTDMVMTGGMTGLELAAKAQSRRPGLKVLYTSGYAESAVRDHEQALRDAEWVAKPYVRQRLAERVRKVLDL
jgi:PAS domain S-box-containing protein